jgi:hypothetical protein
MTRLARRTSLIVVMLCVSTCLGRGDATGQKKSPVCPKAMMREIDDMNTLYFEAGRRHSVVDAASCDEKGHVTDLVLRRQRDGKVIRWNVDQGPAALARIILSGAER